MLKIEMKGGFTTPDITREFARELVDIERDHLSEAFVGHYKPGSLFPTPDETDDELEALGRHWRDQGAINETQAKIKHYIQHGWFRVALEGSEVVGFATAQPERVYPLTLAKRAILRAKPQVKLSRLYMRSHLHDPEYTEGQAMPPIMELGQSVLEHVDPSMQVVSRAADEDHFTPKALQMLSLAKRPVSIHLDDTLLGAEVDPVHMANYQSRRMTA